MRSFRRFLTFVALASLVVTMTARAQEQHEENVVEVTASGETVPAAPVDKPPPPPPCDCTADVKAATAPLQAEKKDLDQKLARTIEELDEIIEERNRLLEDIRRLRESLHAARTESENLRNTLESEKNAKSELKKQLIASQVQEAALKQELEKARAEIKRLNELSFIVQFRKEVVGLWEQLLQFARKLLKKH